MGFKITCCIYFSLRVYYYLSFPFKKEKQYRRYLQYSTFVIVTWKETVMPRRKTRRVDQDPNDIYLLVSHPRFDMVIGHMIDEMCKETPNWEQFCECTLLRHRDETEIKCNAMQAYYMLRYKRKSYSIQDGRMRIQAFQEALNYYKKTNQLTKYIYDV